ncbi:NADH dehydrogenase [ubiquinone] 1 beta subcomplex subunit 10-like isoform X2 [Gigantopelta aegis]|uniref:NADH dehydrogenase [ubiquinone] 1 beta subcomplex subunit 10-like isoform X2 n=1 Tax=Gigantopelta aegis TaxID=1735272 RepID=UPI001B889B2D|nr:NADH dehydrogenase [ubiquinone] 1 beta subcomplex subunit 10-like isoform X2 [Gigantopelta aegis]
MKKYLKQKRSDSTFEKFVEPIQSRNKYPYYHRRFRRVPTIDECEFNDAVCIYEAESQYRRDKMVDEQIVKILRNRKNECKFWEGPDAKVKCRKVSEDYDKAATNWFIKYGDIGANANVISAYMKQKHRLIWERRNPESIMRS